MSVIDFITAKRRLADKASHADCCIPCSDKAGHKVFLIRMTVPGGNALICPSCNEEFPE